MRAQLALIAALAASALCSPFRDTRSTGSTCDPNPCFHGGTCMDMGGLIICVCGQEYRGAHCETREEPVYLEEDPCATNPCLNGGLCYRQDPRGTGSRQFYCVCSGQHTGSLCGSQLLTSSACDANPCQNGGVCRPESESESGYLCQCTDSYGGTNCEILPCDMSPCQNSGECFSGYKNSGEFMCRCPRGFKGLLCQVGDPCMDNPCGEGNMCKSEEDGGFSCMCPCTAGSVCSNPPNGGNGEGGGGESGIGTERPDGGAAGSGLSGGNGGSGGDHSIPLVDGGSVSAMTSRCSVMMRETGNCHNRGYCREDGTGAICRCHPGYRGVTCEIADDSSGSDGGTGSA